MLHMGKVVELQGVRQTGRKLLTGKEVGHCRWMAGAAGY
jgi:hypothetical protein